MYKEHIAEVNAYAQDSVYNLQVVTLFTLATIQQRLETVPKILASYLSDGHTSKYAWGNKGDGVKFATDRATMTALFNALNLPTNSRVDVLSTFMTVPGISLIKGGFLTQLWDGGIGCIDSHNVSLYGVPMSCLKFPYKARSATQHVYRERYINLCDTLGGSVYLWSGWCDYVATLRPHIWESGFEVSKFHVDTITNY